MLGELAWERFCLGEFAKMAAKMTSEVIRSALRSILEVEPDLCEHGYRGGFKANSRVHPPLEQFEASRAELLAGGHEHQFQAAISYLDLVPPSRVKRIKQRNSYNLKHLAESWSRSSNNPNRDTAYVSNGVFILAALYRGFLVEPISHSLNAMVGKSGIAFDWPLPELVGLPHGPQIYFITAGDGLVKIGFSIDVEKRIRSLATGSSAELQILLTINGTRSDEKALHQSFKADRVRREWFRLSPAIQAFIAKHKTDPP